MRPQNARAALVGLLSLIVPVGARPQPPQPALTGVAARGACRSALLLRGGENAPPLEAQQQQERQEAAAPVQRRYPGSLGSPGERLSPDERERRKELSKIAALLKARLPDTVPGLTPASASFPAPQTEIAPESAPAPPWRLGVNILLWWGMNVLFNLANKQCLNSWRHPWALAVVHLAVGSSCMLPLWLPLPRLRKEAGGKGERRVVWEAIRERPKLAAADVRALAPVVALLATGHVTSTLAPAYGTVAFSNIIKTAEPLFTCTFSYVLFRRVFPLPVYVSLILVVFGVALVSARDINFSPFSLYAGMISNAAFALYSILAKRLLASRAETLTPQNTYALLTASSCAVLTPVALLMEWSGAGASRLAAAKLAPKYAGGRLVCLLIATGLLQYLSNEIAFCTLSMIHPVTYAVANTLKRSIVVGASLLYFRQRLPPSGAAGAAIAITGAMLYSLAMQKASMR